jgi:hypothetical protein
MFHHDELYPAEQPSAAFADGVVVAVLRERRGAEWRSALFSMAGVSLASVGALMCVVLELHRGDERERASALELVQQEQALQARLDAHADWLTDLLRTLPDESAAAPAGSPRASDLTARRASAPRSSSRSSNAVKGACHCDPGDPLCSCL